MFVGQSQQQQSVHQQQFMNVASNQKYSKDNKPTQAKTNFSNNTQGSPVNVASSPQTSMNQTGGASSKSKQNSRVSLPNQPRGVSNQSQQQLPMSQQQQQTQHQLSNSSSSQQLQQAQLQQQATQHQHQRSLENNSLNNFEDADKRSARYPDNQQVFVGNLSPDLSENELKQFFGQFGKVVEVRINTNTKQQSGRRLPNYGFVVFDDKLSVDNLLGSSKSNNLTYKNDKGEFRLNVEEKRARQARMSNFVGGGNGAKPDRVTRSSSNSSRNRQQNGTSKKQPIGNHANENYIGGAGVFDKRKEIHENTLIDSNSQRKNTSRRS
jgi:RNA recognition motif-containing protein